MKHSEECFAGCSALVRECGGCGYGPCGMFIAIAHDGPWKARARGSFAPSLGTGARLGVFVFCLFLASVSGARAEGPVLDVDGMTFVATRDARTELMVWAVHARFFTDSETVKLEDVHATVESNDRARAFDLMCERGELNLETNDFRAEGSVTGSTDSGRRFSAPWVQYDHETGLLFTDAPVLITEDAVTFRGGGFEYFVREHRFVLKGGASVVQEP